MQTDAGGVRGERDTENKGKRVTVEMPTLPLIRPVRPSDRDPIRRLIVETKMFTDEEVGIALELVDIVLASPEQQDYVIYVCESDIVVGYYCIGPTPATVGTFDLYWIAVDPSVQGRGIGAALIAHAEQVIRERGGRLIVAETSSQPKYEATRRFYLKRGYLQLARIKDYYRGGDDLIIYGKYIH